MGVLVYLTFDTKCHLPHCTEVANDTQPSWIGETTGFGSCGMEPAGRSTTLDSEKPFHTLLYDLKVPFPLHLGDFISICLMKNVPHDHHLDGVV